MKPLTERQQVVFDAAIKGGISGYSEIRNLFNVCDKSARAVAYHVRQATGQLDKQEQFREKWKRFDEILGDRDPRKIRNVDLAKECGTSLTGIARYLKSRRAMADGKVQRFPRIAELTRDHKSRDAYFRSVLGDRDPRDVTAGQLANEAGCGQYVFDHWLASERVKARAADPNGAKRAIVQKPRKEWADGCSLAWWPVPEGKRRVRCVVRGNSFRFLEVG